MEIINRISEVISTSKVSTAAFARECGIKQQTLSSQLNGVRELSLTTIVAILTTFSNLSAEWLMRGAGTMYKEGDNASTTDAQFDRLMKLVDTITTLQEVVNTQRETIAMQKERIAQLENQLKLK